jgi:hypothetical protein
MSNFLVHYSIRNGEYEYYQYMVIQANDISEVGNLFQRIQDTDEANSEASILLHSNYEEMLSLEGIREITDEQFAVLRDTISVFTLDESEISRLVEIYCGEDSDSDEGDNEEPFDEGGDSE